ncbi:MAG TPA: helix-turn-helix domain-containing GNAT family N-acetyltransferase [Streptosporangiaceae bacterium]|nr:helix-turn-helix domain-containing GNAT family N-acetyltransferase [Streptosporangiaceae bacterium]
MSSDSLTASAKDAAGGEPAGPVTDGQVAAVREFTRFYTNLLGLLREGLLDSPYSMTEARVLFELARQDAVEAAHLRRWLDIDAGYLSRMLARFEADGLVTKARSPADGRRQVIGLTPAGRAVFTTLDARSGDQIRALLAGLTPAGRERLTAAMASIRELIGPAPPPAAFVLRPPAPGDLGWVVQRHGALYAAEYGWEASFEALVARIVADYAARDDHRGEAAWIAELDGEPAGCVFCMRKTGTTAQLRLLLVEPRARGLGMGGRLVGECVSFARRSGYREIVLWTNDVLHAARRIYQRAGFQLISAQPHHAFGHDLVEQDWQLPLA